MTISWSPGSTPAIWRPSTGFRVVDTVHTGTDALAALTEHPSGPDAARRLPAGHDRDRGAAAGPAGLPGRRRHRGDRGPRAGHGPGGDAGRRRLLSDQTLRIRGAGRAARALPAHPVGAERVRQLRTRNRSTSSSGYRPNPASTEQAELPEGTEPGDGRCRAGHPDPGTRRSRPPNARSASGCPGSVRGATSSTWNRPRSSR